MELHILLAGVEFGPYTDNQVRELLGEGFLSETDPAKRLDETDWLPLSDVLAQSRSGTTAPEEPATEISIGKEEPAPPAAESTPEEEPSAGTPPEFEPAAQETPGEIAAPKPPPLPEPAQEVEVSAPETEPAAEAPPIFPEEEMEEPPATAHVEEPAPVEMPAAKQEKAPAAVEPAISATVRPAGATTGPRQLTDAEKTAFLLPVTVALPPVTPVPSHVTTAPAAAPASIAPTPIVSTMPLLQVSLPAKAKKAMRTGALLAQDSLRAARNQKGVLAPTGALALEAVAPPQPATPTPPPASPEPVPVAAPAPVDPPPPRRKSQLILRSREETQALPAAAAAASTSAPAPRKAIRLTGRITLPGLEPKPELPPGQPPSLSGPLVIGRPARTGATPPRALTRPLTAREKSSFLIGQIARPADIAREEIAAETPEMVTAPVLEEKKIEEISAPSHEDEPVDARVQAAGEEIVAEELAAPETAPVSVTALLHAAGTETVAEPSIDSGALPTLEEPPADADLSASGRLISSGELAERRSLKITGPLRHPVPRSPIRLSSPSKPGDSSRLPYSTGERPPTSALPLPEAPSEPAPLPLPPAPEESLPHHPETGKIPVSAMPTEGIRIRSRRITNKVPAPEKEREAEPLSLRVTPPPALPEAAPEPSSPVAEPKIISVTPPPAEPALVVAPPAESIPVVAAEPAVRSEDSPALPGPTLVAEVAAPAAAAVVDEIPAASTAAAAPVEVPEAPEVAKPDKVRLRRPVKLELSSRTKTQESGRLTLEAFSKMASLELPGKTAPTVEVATPAAKETPATSGAPVSPPGPAASSSPGDYDQPRLEEAPPLVWKSTQPKTGRHWEWLSYAVITFLAVAVCAVVYILMHRSGARARVASAPVATTTNTAPASPGTSVPPASAAPPAPAAAAGPAPSKTSAPVPPAPASAKPPATNAAPAAAAPSASIQDLNRQVDADIGAGFLKYQHGDLAGALAADNQALDLNPKSAPALFDRGLVKEAQHDFDGAVADYSAALQIDPTLAAAYYHRGMVRHAKGELDGALADYSQAVQLDPTNAPAFFVRGMIRMQKDDLDGAIADSTRALAIDPHQIPAYYDRGLGRLAKGALDSALSDMKTYCQLAPQDVFTDYARLYIWLIESRQGHLAEANQELAQAMNNNWNGAADSMVTRIGEFLLGQISENELIKSSASAIPAKDQGQRCEVWYFIGMRQLQAGDQPAAIDDLRKCVDTQKTDYCEYILAQEELKNLVPAGANAGPPPAPRAQAVTLPDPGAMAPK